MRKVALAGGLAAIGLIAAACGGGGDSTMAGTDSSVPASSAPAASPDAGMSQDSGGAAGGAAALKARSTDLGSILVDGKGMTLYLFEKDKNGKSSCDDECAQAWPPLLTDGGDPMAGSGVDKSLLGTTQRSDGTTQVTYNDWPLYYYVTDKAPGDVTGQDVDAFGAEWYVLDAKTGKKTEK